MKPCNCITYKDIETPAALNKRAHETKKILTNLDSISVDATGEHLLYRCPVCGQLWQRSLNWSRGNKAYTFRVPAIDLTIWSGHPFVQPDVLFNHVGRIEQYLEHASFIEKDERCRHQDCNEHAIRLSVFCAFHHMENIGLKNDLPDNWTWFAPYKQEDFQLSIGYLKTLPSYKPL